MQTPHLISSHTRAKDKRVGKILERLDKLYPNAGTELVFENEFQLIVAVVLSAQCTDKKVNQVTPELFKAAPDFAALAKIKISAVEKIIRPINYYRTKAKHLVEMGRLATLNFGGKVPRTHDELISLPGVGRKTASVVLSELGAEHAFPVDTHVFRVSRRLGIGCGKNVLEVERSLREQFAPELWRPLHHWFILHGRRVCKAQRPLCAECALRDLCPSRNDEP